MFCCRQCCWTSTCLFRHTQDPLLTGMISFNDTPASASAAIAMSSSACVTSEAGGNRAGIAAGADGCSSVFWPLPSTMSDVGSMVDEDEVVLVASALESFWSSPTRDLSVERGAVMVSLWWVDFQCSEDDLACFVVRVVVPNVLAVPSKSCVDVRFSTSAVQCSSEPESLP